MFLLFCIYDVVVIDLLRLGCLLRWLKWLSMESQSHRFISNRLPVFEFYQAGASVSQSVEPPELRSLKEVQLADVSSNPDRIIKW